MEKKRLLIHNPLHGLFNDSIDKVFCSAKLARSQV